MTLELDDETRELLGWGEASDLDRPPLAGGDIGEALGAPPGRRQRGFGVRLGGEALREANRRWQAAWRLRNLEAKRAANRAHYRAHAAEYVARTRAWRAKNKDKVAAQRAKDKKRKR